MSCKLGTGPIPCVIVKLANLFTSAVLYHVKRWSYWTYWTASETASLTRCFLNLPLHHSPGHATSKMTRSAQYEEQVCHNSTQPLQSKSSTHTATSRSHAGVRSKHYFVHATKSHRCALFSEDCSGQAQDGPTSPWALRDVRILERLHGSRRFAFCMCAFTGSAVFANTTRQTAMQFGPF